MSRTNEVVCSHPLYNTSSRNIQLNSRRNRKKFGSGYSSILCITSEYRVCNTVTDLNSLCCCLIGYSSYFSTTFLSSNEREIPGVKSLAVVGINEVDSRVLVLYNDPSSFKLGGRKISLDFECIGISGFSDNCSL